MKTNDAILQVRMPECIKIRSVRLSRKLGYKSHSQMVVALLRENLRQNGI